MRTQKQAKWKAVLLICLGVVLLFCTYFTLVPGQLYTPGLIYGVYSAIDPLEQFSEHSAAVVRVDLQPQPGKLVLWQDVDGFVLDRVMSIEDGVMFTQAETPETVDMRRAVGLVEYQMYGMGTVIDVLSNEPGRFVVWAVDGGYVLLVLVLLATRPARKRKARREQYVRAFEQYGAQFDMEDEGVEF